MQTVMQPIKIYGCGALFFIIELNYHARIDDNVSSSYSTENDVARVKYGLSQLNYYKEPKNLGMSTIPDSQMFEGVKKYQKDKGLHVDGLLKPKGETINSINNDLRKKGENNHSLLGNIKQSLGAAYDMGNEYFKMKSHNYKGLDDYHHCKANYNAASRGEAGYNTAKYLGELKEDFDYYKNIWYKGLSEKDAKDDKIHDLSVNADGRLKKISGKYKDAKNACAVYRKKNPGFPEEYW